MPECGLNTQSFPRGAIAGMIRDNAAAWHDVLAGPGDARRRPAPGKWSALEYGCHVRDVVRLYDQRLQLMLTQDEPQYPNWDQDATAVADCYGERDPAMVADELTEAAEAIAARFETVTGDLWQRTGARSDGAQFTVSRSRATSSTTRFTTSTMSPATRTPTRTPDPDHPTFP